MKNQQYLDQISEILKVQREKKLVYTEEIIEDLKKVKPVSLGVQMIEILNKIYRGEEVDIYDFEKGIPITSEYPHLLDVLDTIQKIYLENNKLNDVERVAFTKSFIRNEIEAFCAVYDNLEIESQKIINNQNESMKEILRLLYIVEDTVALGILSSFSENYRNLFKEPNLGFLAEELMDENSKFILIANESNEFLIELLALFLKNRKQEVFLLKKPLLHESDDVNIKDTFSISVENIQKTGNLNVIYPIKLISEKNGAEDNISYLLEYINNHYNESGHINVLGQGYQIDEISVRPFTNKKMTRLSQFYYDKREYNVAFARYGDYLAYISKIYKEDCRELLYRKPTKRFSIVVPARDSVSTLQYTLKTCLDQTFTGDYEVVVSDNSFKNTDVYELCKELDDPKIVYIKTPRNLSLPKSFEFAYLHTSGEFVFSIGSDDGVLPWALEVLDPILSLYPEQSVIQWSRGFYAWPGFNYGQQHQFEIPNDATPQKFEITFRKSDIYLASILNNPRTMYALPLLYINSGFRREFMEVVYQRTGELFDGNSQDLYTGLIAMMLNDKIMNLSLSLTVAGMSSNSVGASSDKVRDFQMKMNQQKMLIETGNMGMNVQSMYEHLVPVLRSDVAGLYFSVMRGVSKGLFFEQIIETRINWKTVFTNILDCLCLENITYCEDLYKVRYAASLHGNEFLKWFDEMLLNEKMQLCVINEESLKFARIKKTYVCGANGFNGVIWDASEYGVQDIYGAVQLFRDTVKDM